MRNKYEVARLAREAGVPLTKVLPVARVGEPAVELEVERPMYEVIDDLREIGVIK